MAVHPHSVQLQRALVRCLPLATGRECTAFRASNHQYASRDDVVTGAGSRRAGGRWNPLGSFHTVYLSMQVETAVAEYLGQYAHAGVAAARLTPFTVVGVELKLLQVLDLTSPQVRRTLGLSVPTLLDDGWKAAQDAGGEAITQAIGRLSCLAGFDGLVVPSAALRRGANLVAFPANLRPPDSYLKIVNADQLPAFADR